MMRKSALLLAGTCFLSSLPFTVQAQAPIISNQPHKAASAGAVVNQKANAAPMLIKKQPQTEKTPKAAAKASSKKQNKGSLQTKAAAKQESNRTQAAQGNWRLKTAQQKLQVLGLSNEKPTGRMTDATSAALKSFQQKHKLQANGKLDDTTYRKLTWEAFSKEGIAKVQGSEIVSHAAKYKGVPYVFGGTTPKGFDCSGYVQYVFKTCKANLPRLADEQAQEGVFVTQTQLRPGDLVFFTTYMAGASHVGIYAGNGRFWSASSSKGVVLSSLKEDYWKSRYYGARRVLITNGEVK